MKLSQLQKYILIKCYNSKKQKVNRNLFLGFYNSQKSSAKKESQQKVITGSLENLINKSLMIGYGRRTPNKWFIREVKLTKQGNNLAKKLLGEQLKLKLKVSAKGRSAYGRESL